MSNTGYDYYPMQQGISHEMDVYEITANVARQGTNELMTSIPSDVFDYRLEVSSRIPHGNSPQYFSFHHDASYKSFGSLPYFTTYVTSIASREFLDNSSLVNSFGFAWDGQAFVPYIGEVRNQNEEFTMPPNPLLPLNPREGQVLDVHLSLYNKEGIMIGADWRTSLYVLGHYDTWATYKDCWAIVLTERGGGENPNPHIYEYVFAKHIGIVDVWHGSFNSGVVTGFQYFLKNIIKGTR